MQKTTQTKQKRISYFLAASWMTKASLIYEFAFGYVIVYYLLCPVFTSVLLCKCEILDEHLTTLLPLLFIDSLAIIVLGPFGNVYLFLLGCTEALVMIGIRIGLYLSAISLPAVYIYLLTNDDPQTGALKTFVIILFKLALKLITCSSCLATFIDIAYPERPIFRYFYLSFTILIGLSALLTYYQTLLKLFEIIYKRHRLHHDQCCEWFNHCTFWAYAIANISLMGMNAFILHKYIDTDGFDSSGVSLVLNVSSVVLGGTIYVFGATFCGRQPIYKVLYDKYRSRKDKFHATPHQAGINYYIVVY